MTTPAQGATDPIAAFLAGHGLLASSASPIPGTPATVAELVSEAARRYGDAPALADRRGGALSFAALEHAVDRAAGRFAAAGLQPLDRVAVCLPNGTDVVLTFLAAMRRRLVWVGVNTNLVASEKIYLVGDCGASAVVATAGVLAELAEVPAGVTRIEVDPATQGSWYADARPVPYTPGTVDPFAPAAIAYTSGTTGRSKGAVHSQHNLLLPAASFAFTDPGPRVHGVCLPLTICNMQVLATVHGLLTGSTVVPLDRIDVDGVVAAVRELAIQRMFAPPPTVYDLVTRPEIDPADLASLDRLGVGGAKVPEGLAERYHARFGRRFASGYGLTEAPTAVTGYDWTGPLDPPGSAGRTRPHVAVTIRNGEGALAAAGEEGEICIEPASSGPFAGCASPMLGYWDRPEATATTLRGGVLHTGDVGAVDGDGVLWVRDRRSDLILRGGANVYPAEVERVLEATGLVAETAVVGRPHERLGDEVVAFVTPAPGASLDVADLDAACRQRLAGYKVPVSWYVLEQFPRNAMGKVVKAQLRTWLADGEPATDALTVHRQDLARPGREERR